MVFRMQCGHCDRFVLMEDEWCGTEIECPLCGRPIEIDPVVRPDPPGGAEPPPPPLVKARPKRPAQ